MSQIIVMTFSGKPACLAKKPWSLAFPFPFPPCPHPAHCSLSGLTGACALRLSSRRVLCRQSTLRLTARLCRLCLEPRASTFSGASCLFTVWRGTLQSPGAGGERTRPIGRWRAVNRCTRPIHPKARQRHLPTAQEQRRRAAWQVWQRGSPSAGVSGRPGELTAPGFYGCV